MDSRELLSTIIITLISSGTISAIVTAWLQRKPKSKVQSELNLDIAEMVKTMMDGGDKSIETATKLFGYYEKRIEYTEKRNDELSKELAAYKSEIDIQTKKTNELIDALLGASVERNKLEDRVTGLMGRIEDLEQNEIELIKNRSQREERMGAMEENIRGLLKQVATWEEKYNTLKKEYDAWKEKYSKAIDILIKALDDAKISIPDELAHLLGDSIARFKLKKPGEK